RGHEIEAFARAVATKLGVQSGALKGGTSGDQAKWIAAVVKELEQHRGRSVVLAGDRQPPAVHLLAYALNERLGNIGQTVLHTEPVEGRPVDPIQSLHDLVQAIDKDEVELLVILGGNPAFTAPADFRFAELIKEKPKLLRFHLSLFQDETSRLCQ